MALIAKAAGGGDFKPVPAGQYAAVCYSVVDLGDQYSPTYDKWSQKVRITWELHGENQIGDSTAQLDDGSPMSISREFSLSLAENSKLRPFLEQWRGKAFTEEELAGFDVTKLLGAPCMVSVQHEASKDGTKKYANVVSATPLLKSIAKPTQHNPSILFEVDAWDNSLFEKLPEFVRKRIEESRQYKERAGIPATSTADDTPFPADDDLGF